MKKIVGIDQEFGGGDVKGNIGAQLAIEGSDLVADVTVKAKLPLAKVVAPAMQVVGNVIDKIEQWIPGDQKAMAAALKLEAEQELVKLISEQA